VRSETSRRESAEGKAADAQRLLDDPAFKRGFAKVRDALIYELEQVKHDGQPETDDRERELCRSLRTLMCVRRAISIAVQGQALKLATLIASEPDKSKV